MNQEDISQAEACLETEEQSTQKTETGSCDSVEPSSGAEETTSSEVNSTEATSSEATSSEATSTEVTSSEATSSEVTSSPEPETTAPSPEAVSGEGLVTATQFADFSQELSEKFSSLEALFQRRILHSQGEEKAIDQLHSELQDHRQDLYAQLVRPILLDLIGVRESILRMSASYLAKPEGEQSIPNKTFSAYSYDLEDILEKNNVVIYQGKVGEPFDALKQRIGGKIPTQDESLHGKVASLESFGYSYGKWVLSHEKVQVYGYEAPTETTDAT